MMTADRANVVHEPLAGPVTLSGKSAKTENFPVASILIAPALRPHVMCFYEFARTIDDIADDPVLSSAEKITQLNAFEAVVTGASPPSPGLEKAAALRRSLADTGVSVTLACDLAAAFRQDAVKSRYASLDELMGYCALSADPVGRYLLALHGEDDSAVPASDALCSALQIINHLQDCGDDYRTMDRVYLPSDWMAAAGAQAQDLGHNQLTPGLRRTLDQAVDHCAALLAQADTLAPAIRSRRLSAEAAVITQLAHRLVQRLRTEDPLAARVALSKWDIATAATKGGLGSLFSRKRLVH